LGPNSPKRDNFTASPRTERSAKPVLFHREIPAVIRSFPGASGIFFDDGYAIDDSLPINYYIFVNFFDVGMKG
jgi:hypothetical protein